MSISGISSASLYAYQWNSQQLQGTVSNTNNASSKATNAYSYEGSSTVSSMVELAKYAMEAMGVSSNERVTFKQVEDYKKQLEESFSEQFKTSIQNTNVSDLASFSVAISAEGKVTINSTHADKTKIQAFFDVNKSYVEDLRATLDDNGFKGDVEFAVSPTGDILSVTSKPITQEIKLEENPAGSSIIQALQNQSIVVAQSFSVRFDGTALVLEGEHPNKAEIEAYLAANPQHALEVKESLEGQGLAVESVVVINANGTMTVSTTTPDLEADAKALELQKFLQDKSMGENIKDSLANMGIDENIDFRLTIVDGKIVVNSSHSDADKVQALLDSNEDLTKLYLQIDALAGLEGARKSMQIDPVAMRSRIQMESLAAWWDQTGTSSIGSYFSGSLSSFTGVNSVA